MRRTLALSTAAIALAGAAPFAVADDAPPQLPAAGSEGMEIVAQVPGAGGTDIEFFSRAVANVKNANGQVVPDATDKVRDFAVVGNQQSNARIVDITDPEHPFVAAEIPCAVSQGDVQVNEERSIIAIASTSASNTCPYLDAATGTTKQLPAGAAIVDITDVYNPKVVGAAPASGGAHNLTLTPDGEHLYISTSAITQAQSAVPIYSLADPTAPELVGTFSAPGNSPHDIRFNADGTRAYTAGVSTFRILNTEDPTKPTVISTFFPPGASIGHDVVVSPDGAYLFAGDEAGGGLTYPCPGGAVHTYDIRNEALPVYLGQTYAGAGPVTNRDAEITTEVGDPGSCTSHVMEMNPDGRSITLGWYAAGSRILDFSDLYGADGKPTPGPAAGYGHDSVGLVETGWIRPDDGSTWAAKQYAEVPGYIFSNDRAHGLYVTKLPTS